MLNKIEIYFNNLKNKYKDNTILFESNGNNNLEFFGKERNIDLIILSRNNKFSDCKVLAYKNFSRNTDEFLRKTEEKVFNYYQSVCEEYRDAIGDEDFLDKIAPIINNKEQINELISQIKIYIFDSYDDIRNVGIGMECT